MGLYALGALKAYGFLYPIEDIFFSYRTAKAQ